MKFAIDAKSSFGGRMDNIPLVDLQMQYRNMKDEIDTAISRVISHAKYVGGHELDQFESAFANYQGTKRCVGVSSGTSALFLTLKALDIGPGDEVITTPHTFIATVEAIEMTGARPVFVDVDPVSFNLLPDAIEAALSSNTKAILPVHMYGQMAEMDSIVEIAKQKDVFVIEDAAHAHGAEYKGKRAGQWGHAACFSFYPSKNLGAYGDAGAVCTNDDILAESIIMLRNHGEESKHMRRVMGYCERLDSLQAAILATKLPYLDDWNRARRERAKYYGELLKSIPHIYPPKELPDRYHVYHLYCVQVESYRNEIHRELNDRGINSGIHYPTPIHLEPAMSYLGYMPGSFPNAERAANSVISLPIYPELSDSQTARVASEFIKIVMEMYGN